MPFVPLAPPALLERLVGKCDLRRCSAHLERSCAHVCVRARKDMRVCACVWRRTSRERREAHRVCQQTIRPGATQGAASEEDTQITTKTSVGITQPLCWKTLGSVSMPAPEMLLTVSTTCEHRCAVDQELPETQRRCAQAERRALGSYRARKRDALLAE